MMDSTTTTRRGSVSLFLTVQSLVFVASNAFTVVPPFGLGITKMMSSSPEPKPTNEEEENSSFTVGILGDLQ